MKLDWEINEFRVLKAKVGEVTYYVAPGAVNLWEPSKRYTAFDGKVATVWPVEGGMSLTNAIAWCERDVERPEGCPAQPPAMDPVAPKTSGGMSKFPDTMDASVWASRCTAWFGAFKVPDLTDWFQAALSFAYVRGSEETLEKQKLAASPNPVCPLDSFDARVWAKEFMRCNNGLSGPFVSSHVRVDEETMVGWFANALMRGYDERRSRENGWQKFTRDTYAEFLAKNPYPPPPVMDPVASKTSGGMSKFPSTMDAKGWAAGFVKEGVEPHDYLGVDSEEALVAWFQAALSHGFREGQASVYELVDKAQRSEAAFGPEWAPATDPLLAESLFPNAEGDPAPPCAGGPSTLRCPACGAAEVDALTPRTVYACGSSDYDQRPGTFRQKCAREKEPPTSAQAPEPSSVEEQIENLAWGLKNEIKRAAERDNEVAERLGAYEAWLTQFVASKCQELDLRINEHLKKLGVKS